MVSAPQQVVRVRPAVRADIPALVRWNQAMALETEQRELDGATLADGVSAVLEDPAKGFYLLAERDGVAVGSLLVTFEWSDWRNAQLWWLQSVYVEPEARQQGVFGALFADLRGRAKTSGVAALRLYVERDNKLAQRVYEGHGMQHSTYLMYALDLV